MQSYKISIIGGGNLGTAIALGIAQSDMLYINKITLTRRKIEKIRHLGQQGIAITADNQAAAQEADILILALKPKVIRDVLAELKNVIKPETIVVSVATGVSIAEMQAVIGTNQPIFRAMPNTAIAIRESMTCIAMAEASHEQKNIIENLFEQLGSTVFIDEELMASATVLAACGIAYSMRYIRAASQGGIEIGFDAQTAQKIAAQMVKGSAALLLANGQHPEYEIDKVTTPQGCTITGLNEMEHRGFSSALIKGILSSYHKIADIAEQARPKQ
ncbi:MAG: pyrroline-5-carboxylate reductase [Bernardetiaceae bacterium]|nr:pyrroline-5-carboxylate reductase [Bernardetiaceae bacterium]